jgi:hypothetical protein
MKLSKEIVEQIKSAKSVEEVLSIAADCNVEMTVEEAKEFLTQLDPCELDDDVLENVSGGLVQLVNPSSSRL